MACDPSVWPPDGGYRVASNGWYVSNDSEWLHKPGSGVFFHSPTESLWKRDFASPRGFVRVGSELMLAALGSPLTLRVCFVAWRGHMVKFEDMERDLVEHCQAQASASITPPRVSATGCDTSMRKSNVSDSVGGKFVSAFTGIFTWMPNVGAQFGPEHHENYVGSMPLTASTLMRHQMQVAMRKMPNKHSERNHRTLAVVHRDREQVWRHHISEAIEPLPEVSSAREFDGRELGLAANRGCR